MQENENNNSFPWDDSFQYHYAKPVSKPKKQMRTGSVVALALVCALLGGIVGAGSIYLGGNWLQKADIPSQTQQQIVHVLESNREQAVIETVQTNPGKIMTPAEVYAANVNSTVGITTSITTNYWGYQTTSAAAGSGFIFSDTGHILTNFHVIENSDSITVSLYNGESYPAALLGYDESHDLAVLKIEAEHLTPVILGDSDQLNVGESVVAIGNPLGELTFSLTSGAISAKDREITMSNGATMNLLQTDCAINSGNSGGALFNLYGEVVGITNAKYSSSSSGASIDNIGFAIPINQIRDAVESIIEKGYIVKPYIGVSITDVSAETQSYGLPEGAAVRNIVEDGPAAKAGLRVNDIITQINGQAITGKSDLVRLVQAAAPGDILKLTVYRQGGTLELEITVGEQIQQAMQEDSSSDRKYPWQLIP